MVYSLLYKSSSFCMHYDLGMEDEFWFGWIHEKKLGWKYLSTDIQPTGLSFTLFWLCLVSSICIKVGAVDLYLGRIEQTPN
jgi:hypothetical protein